MSFLIFVVGLPMYLATIVSTGTGLTLYENTLNSIFSIFANALAMLRIQVPV